MSLRVLPEPRTLEVDVSRHRRRERRRFCPGRSSRYLALPERCVERAEGGPQVKKAGLMGNNRKAPVPALQREPQVEPDSSDEEAERLELLGQQGK